MGDKASFDERFDALAVIAYRVAYRLLGHRDEAEEIAQEALARAFSRWRRVSGYDEPWVARVATNLAIDVWRKRRPNVALIVLRYLADLPESEVAVLLGTSVGSVKQHCHLRPDPRRNRLP